MADDWIKLRHATATGPKVSAVRVALGCPRAEALGLMVMALLMADEHADPETGLIACPEAAFDDLCGREGTAAALASIGWLEVVDGGVRLLDYHTHNGQSAKRRAADAKRSEVRRKSAKSPQRVRTDADEKRTACGPREEKRQTDRREESKDQRQGVHPDSISVCLSGWRIGEPSRSQLISAGLEVPDAFAAWEAAAGARDRKAAFVWACKQGLGLETRKATKAVPMSPEMQRVVSRIEAARKNKA